MWYSEKRAPKARFSIPVSKRLPTHFQRGIPPAIASSSSSREPITTSASPAWIGAHHLGHERRVVLVVGVDHHDDVGAVAQGPHVARSSGSRRSRGWPGGGARRGRRASATAVVSSGLRVVDQQRAVGGARPASRRDDVGIVARGLVGRQHDVHLRAAAAVLQQRLARRARPRPVGEDHALVAERQRRAGAAGRAAATERSTAPRQRPAALGQPADPVARRENVRTNGTSSEITSPRAAISSRSVRAREQARVRGQVAPPARAGEPRGARRRVGRDDAEHAARARAARAQRSIAATGSSRCSSTSASTTRRSAPARAVGEAPRAAARARRGRARRARTPPRRAESSRPRHLVAAPARLVEQQAVAAADVEQRARAARARRSGRAAGSRSRAGRPPREVGRRRCISR